MKTLLNAWLIWRASKKNSTSLMTAAIAINGGWRAALAAWLVVWAVRLLISAGAIAAMLLGSGAHH